MNTAYLYVRVSTDEQADKGYSQRNQDEVLNRYCLNKTISVKRIIYEDHSAKNFNRPAWKEMLREIKKSSGKNRPNYILFTKWDRFSRNTADAYQMISILNSYNIEPQAIEQPLDLSIPENKMMLAFYLAVPEVENDRRGLNIFYGIRRAKKEGRWMGHAPVGYQNKSTDTGRKYIRPNIPQAKLMKRAFEEIATGKFTIEQIWKKARNEGLESQSSNFQAAIRNPVYFGKIIVPEFKDEPLHLVDGQHEAIITEELFYRVQKVLMGNGKPKGTSMNSIAHYPIRGFVRCPKCARMLTASTSKGRIGYYHYYHCSNICKIRFKAPELNRVFTAYLGSFIAKNAFKGLFKEVLKDIFKRHTIHIQQQREQLSASIDSQKNRLVKVRELLIDDKLGSVDYQIAKSDINNKIMLMENQLDKLPDLKVSLTKLLNANSRKFLDLAWLFKVSSTKDQRTLVANLFTQPLSYFEDHFLAEPMPVVGLIYKIR